MPVELTIPAAGESITEVFLGAWLKQEGDSIATDEPLVEVETDKATLELPSPIDGVLSKIVIAEGSSANVGDVIALLEASGAAASAPAASESPATSEPATSAPAASETVDVVVPEAGESITEVFLGEWLKQEGDSVAQDEPLVEVETDKATLELPSPVSGVIRKIVVQSGASAQVGNVIAQIEAGAVPAASAPVASEPAASAPSSGVTGGAVMPAAARAAAQAGIDPQAVSGTGPGGRVLKEDVARHAATPAPQPAAAASPPAPVGDRHEEAVPMTPLRRTIARRLVASQQTTATLTTFNEVDMGAVKALRAEFKDPFEKKHGARLGFMSFFVRATVEALKAFPQLNAYVEDNNVIYHNFYDISVAVSGKKGLLVPVIRNAERLSFAEIEKTIADFGVRAQANKITPDELAGGTFTISNGGVFGSMLSTPIINPPQSGVLGLHNIVDRPVAIGGKVEIRPIMYLALSYDHRIVDGREAVTFLRSIKAGIENPARLLLEV